MQDNPRDPSEVMMAPEASPPRADRVLDVRDLRCPLPVLRSVKALRSLAPGAVLEVWTTDPASVEDMRALAARGAADLLAQHRDGETIHHWLRQPTPPESSRPGDETPPR
ncbi:sulfurtransferase TusA family protein [Roseospira visakhapatnamensis]|uniref:TusA-related sulfurtransferase n=1 Tax=Roseospira visakhapatnamensis TaxID=390880 RepID=A0A7W6W8E2_9PROT|nr:sulfurtransferase TusA family protein [Roseospira visakhapatnamensis]MBB4264769.1 TusA-related sulfurtransferase [Roseospira visakhapatnamensis]